MQCSSLKAKIDRTQGYYGVTSSETVEQLLKALLIWDRELSGETDKSWAILSRWSRSSVCDVFCEPGSASSSIKESQQTVPAETLDRVSGDRQVE